MASVLLLLLLKDAERLDMMLYTFNSALWRERERERESSVILRPDCSKQQENKQMCVLRSFSKHPHSDFL